MNPTWLRLVWMNRERIVAAARKLKWPLRTWVAIGVVGVIAAAVWWLVTHGHVVWSTPNRWPLAQWVIVLVNLVGFTWLGLALRVWFKRQDEVWEEVDQLRSQIDGLRAALYDSQHGDDEGHVAAVLPVVDRIPTEELPEVGPSTVFMEPVGTVAKELGGRTFRFRE